MKSNHRKKKSSTSSSAAAPYGHSTGILSEWPLLVLPLAVLGALVVLSVVDRSIRRDVVARPASEQAAQDKARTASATQSTDPTASMGRKNGPRSPRAGFDSDMPGEMPHTGGRPTPTRDGDRPDVTSRVSPEEQIARRATLEGLQGPELIVAILCDAIRSGNQAAIKKCLDDLVAMGDQAIAPLTQVISSELDDTGLWAAEALVRIGSPLATSALLDTLSQIKEGPYKEQLGKRVAGISNHESWPVLLDNILATEDATVLRAASMSLAGMADKAVVDELIARYDGAATARDAERIAKIVGNIQSPNATDSLISLAGDITSAPQDMLQQAAIDALGKVGDPQAVSHLIRRLESSPPGEGGSLFSTISQIKQPQAQEALLYAAAGNKEVSAESGRTAAICALANFPDAKTCALLQQIVANEDNERVATAAARTLDSIHRTSPHVVANAQSLVKKDPYGPAKK